MARPEGVRLPFRRALVLLLTTFSTAASAQEAANVPPAPPGAPDGEGEAVVFTPADFGAVGNAVADDTAALQAAIDALPRGGRLRFSPRVHRIRGDVGLHLKDDVTLEMGNATIVAANVNGARCRIFTLEGDKRVTLSGGTLVGSRVGTPQWGVGILASDAEDLVVQGTKLRDFFTDGILLTGNRGCRRVAVRNTVSENNRRSGMSVVAASDVSVEFSTFRGTVGQSPQAGVNVEPNSGGDVRNVRILGSTFESNRGIGVYVHKGLGRAVATAAVVSSLVRGNDQGIVFDGVSGASVVATRVLGHSGPSKTGIVLGTTTGTVAANRVEGNTRGILSLGASRVTIQANQVVGLGPTAGSPTDADGIVCRGVGAHALDPCVISGNVVSRFAGTGILTQLVGRVRVLDNVVDAVGQRGLWARETTYSELLRNRPSRVGLGEPGRYNAIEVTHASHYNVVTGSHCSLGTSARGSVAVATGCVGNRVYANTP